MVDKEKRIADFGDDSVFYKSIHPWALEYDRWLLRKLLDEGEKPQSVALNEIQIREPQISAIIEMNRSR